MLDLLAAVLFGAAAVLWFVLAFTSLLAVLRVRPLPPAHSPVTLPSVSVVVAARDEAQRIETTVRRLLAQRGVTLQVIVVDDRSRDGTGDVVARLAQDDPRLVLVRVEQLPDGWLGKCHALHIGAAQATGDWLLFTDADTWLGDDVLLRATAWAERERADHVALTPGQTHCTFLGRACLLLFHVAMAHRMVAANRDRPGAALGVGAFNLVRAAAYRAIGGHEPLRLEVVDDMKLGLLLRRAGFRTRSAWGAGDVDCDWVASAPGLVRAMEKNHFALLGFRLWAVVAATLVYGSLWMAAIVGPWTLTPAGIAAGLGLLLLTVPAVVVARTLRWPVLPALAIPFVFPVLVATMCNSAWATLRAGGVRWRDTFYPLDTLRAGRVR